ncbi:rhodanese-related sulfurtransferase [Angulomicrobium tetraedrale]|uniref:Rhodanese-related sulfurtransferase n=1 Tax=Ancylobacter tetraedralis TaxID=217068 RepID=A0A839Z340_9HYPH|nr:rhodanese-like domain-containing protein [Ancylobacter tetraedralis]MBB3770039.1 rhodanese-related sulfurtransferase [Ancylobacter tetraedralis]
MTETTASEVRPAFRITAAEAHKAVAQGALLIDVRSLTGRNRDGEVAGAVVVAKPDVVDVLTRRVARVAPEQKIVLFCGSPKGSEPLVRTLIEAGFSEVYDVEGGAPALLGGEPAISCG